MSFNANYIINLDPLNETRLLNSDDVAHATFLDNYGSSSFREAHNLSNKISNSIKKNINVSLSVCFVLGWKSFNKV